MNTGPDQTVEAYVAVGSNIDPAANVVRAVRMLARRARLTGVSTFWRTESIGPDGRPDGQPEFVNGVLRVEADCDAREIKYGVLRPIEESLGRARDEARGRYVPRTIDLDLVIFGLAVIDEPDLRIPAPELAWPFVAAGVLELAPEMVLPGSGEVLSCLFGGAAAAAGLTPDEELTRQLKEFCVQ